MSDASKTAPCRICGKELPLPPWPIIEGSIACLEHSMPGIKCGLDDCAAYQLAPKEEPMTTKQSAISKLKILLGEIAAESQRAGETDEQFIETLKEVRKQVNQTLAKVAGHEVA